MCSVQRRDSRARCRTPRAGLSRAGPTWAQTRYVCAHSAYRCVLDGKRGGESSHATQTRYASWRTSRAGRVSSRSSSVGQVRRHQAPDYPCLTWKSRPQHFCRRLGFAIHGEVVCAAVTIGTQAYVCQALGIPQSPDASRQKAQLLAFYCSPEGVCWFAPERAP